MVVMQIMHKVKPECVEAYIEAMVSNAHATKQEPGNLRFDLLRAPADPCSFMLYEVYKDQEAHKAHLGSKHFMTWKETVKDMFVDRAINKFEAMYIS